MSRRLDDDIRALGHDDVVRVIQDEPDMSFRPLRSADLVICGQDVPSVRIDRLQRALGSTGWSGSLVRIVPEDATRDTVLKSLTLGANGILRADEVDTELPAALREVIDNGRYYLSASLIPFVLEHYRELCGAFRRMRGLNQAVVGALLPPYFC